MKSEATSTAGSACVSAVNCRQRTRPILALELLKHHREHIGVGRIAKRFRAVRLDPSDHIAHGRLSGRARQSRYSAKELPQVVGRGVGLERSPVIPNGRLALEQASHFGHGPDRGDCPVDWTKAGEAFEVGQCDGDLLFRSARRDLKAYRLVVDIDELLRILFVQLRGADCQPESRNDPTHRSFDG